MGKHFDSIVSGICPLPPKLGEIFTVLCDAPRSQLFLTIHIHLFQFSDPFIPRSHKHLDVGSFLH